MSEPAPTIGEAISWHARQDPEALAVRDQFGSIDRAELDAASSRYAELLIRSGVQPDDLVTLRLPNTIEFVVACVGIWKAGATPQPLSHRFSLAEQRAVVELADSRVVVGAGPGEFPGRITLPAGADTGRLAGIHPADLAARSWKAPTSSGSTGRPKNDVATAPARFAPKARVAL
ncbi:MAG: bile acid-coenzyme ligase, partial [Glaciihabitans sp.]|nr:bile acid-coenzyme ligase [Glaciihabitans sp.]